MANKLLAILFLIIIVYQAQAIFNYHKIQQKDTIFLKKKTITGTVKDITHSDILILDSNNNLQAIKLWQVKRAYLSSFHLPPQLKTDTLKIGQTLYYGKVLYFNDLTGKILFLNFKTKRINSYPFFVNQNDKFIEQKLKFYRINCYNALIIFILSLLTLGFKYIFDENFYFLASVSLLLMASFAFKVFCCPIKNYRKFQKSKQ